MSDCPGGSVAIERDGDSYPPEIVDKILSESSSNDVPEYGGGTKPFLKVEYWIKLLKGEQRKIFSFFFCEFVQVKSILVTFHLLVPIVKSR